MKKTIAKKGIFFGSLQVIQPISIVPNAALSRSEDTVPRTKFSHESAVRPAARPRERQSQIGVPGEASDASGSLRQGLPFASRVRHGFGVNLVKESQ
jgi:hypothetical protein